MLQDTTDVGYEAHVQHPVALVEHQHFDVAQVNVTGVDVVEQPAGAGDDDLRPTLQGGNLRPLTDATVDGGAANLGVAAQHDGRLMDLLGQLARRGDDEHPRLAQGAARQPLQNGQHESRRLARARLGQPEHIAALQNDGNALFLDGGRRRVTGIADAGLDTRVERKVLKLH